MIALTSFLASKLNPEDDECIVAGLYSYFELASELTLTFGLWCSTT